MTTSINTQVRPAYRLLTEEQIDEFHRAALEVMETVGVRVMHPEAVEMLCEAGCRAAYGDNVVLIPNWLVEECLRTAPRRITIYNRKGDEAMRLEGRNNYFGLGTDLLNTIDLETGKIRPSLLRDVENAARVADYCRDIDFCASFALPHDVPTNTMYAESVRAMLQNTPKPLFNTAAGKEDLACIIEMCEVVAGGAGALRDRPFFILYAEPTPPLTHSYGAVNKLFLCADRGVPVCYTPGTILGASGPVTMAGVVVQAAAEALSGVVLHQLRARGAPIITGFCAGPLDMRTAALTYASPVYRLANSAMADLFHSYGIPIWSTVGSDSQVPDEQAAMEHGIATLLAALDGGNLIHDVGYLGQGLVSSPAAIVMCDEIISYVRHFMRGFEMDRPKLAVDVIRRVGPGGNYLAEPHTAQHFRSELWQAKHANRDNLAGWQAKGGRRYGEVVADKARLILATHRPEPLAEDVAEELAAITERAARDLAGFQFVA